MTISEFSHAVRRGWVVLLLGMVVTAGVVAWIHQRPGVHYSRASVYFLGPIDRDNKNTVAYTTDSVIATAGLVAQLVDPHEHGPATATDTTLAAEGVTHGYRVVLPNSGGQWSTNFAQPVLDVQVVDPSADAVQAQMARLLTRIQSTLVTMQDRDHVAAANRISTNLPQADPVVLYSHGDPKRAIFVAGLLGLGISYGGAAGAGIALQRRRKARNTLLGAAHFVTVMRFRGEARPHR
ncbi:MAG: hypothetical protein JWO46_3120 [Nocardioidaceae bacterium]|nr:hypothetical protein [Nocardioidaceae bacterium]